MTPLPRSATPLFRAMLLVVCALLPCGGRAEEGDGPLSRPVRCTLWGVGLGDAVRELERQTGVALRFHLADFPGDPGIVHLAAGGTSLEAVLEALSRRFAFRFRVAGSGRVEISRGYGWVNSPPVISAFTLPPLTGDGAPDATRALLMELIKPLALLEDASFLKVERHPLPEEPDGLRATAALPPVLAGYLEAGVAALRGDDRPRVDGAGRPFARARALPADGRLAAKPVSVPGEDDLAAEVRRLAEAAGAVIILGAPPPEAPLGKLPPADGPSAPLHEAAARLGAAWGLGRPVFLPHGLAFDAGEAGPAVWDKRSRELFWDGLAVEGMEARRAAERAGGGDALITLLRNEIFPSLWNDPATAMAYSPVTGRLAVVAPANAVEAVRERLSRIR